MTSFRPLIYAGVHFGKTPSERRSIALSNFISLALCCLGTLLFFAYYYWYGWWLITAFIEIIAILCILPVVFNHFNQNKIGRIWVCLLVPLTTLALSVYSKRISYHTQQELDYFTFRFIILAGSVFPVVFFSFREKVLLLMLSFISFSALILYDPVHKFFEVPYPTDILKTYNYYFTNVVVFVTYAILAGAIVFLRRISEDSENKYLELIKTLNVKNEELVQKNSEIEMQNHEITAQTENLNLSQKKLQDAYKIIEDQKELVVRMNKQLSSELVEINKDLTATNNELIRHNNELRQFSYTVSHNLRGPVASLSGLINLIDPDKLDRDTFNIYQHTRTSIQRLEAVIKDLSHIIDIRNDVFHIRTKVDLTQEVQEIRQILEKEIKSYDVSIKAYLQQKAIYSVKPMIHSILYNLISNAIKYRSQQRRPEIKIVSKEDQKNFILEISDNGLGIDLKNHKQNLFKLYKRFHFHTEGKGLGLYLVKLQAEALGGHVEVQSEINRHTTFTVSLPKPKNIEQQILFKSAYATIFYDARINSTGVIWDGPVSSEQYRFAFTKCLEFVKAYNTPNYIADLSRQGYVNRDDQQWMFNSIMPEATRYGLRRIAAVRPNDFNASQEAYLKGISDTLMVLGVEQEYFDQMDEATRWIEIRNELSTISK